MTDEDDVHSGLPLRVAQAPSQSTVHVHHEVMTMMMIMMMDWGDRRWEIGFQEEEEDVVLNLSRVEREMQSEKLLSQYHHEHWLQSMNDFIMDVPSPPYFITQRAITQNTTITTFSIL